MDPPRVFALFFPINYNNTEYCPITTLNHYKAACKNN